MGSHNLEMLVKTQSERKFLKLYKAAVYRDKQYHGDNPYSGSWATIPEVRIVNDPFPERRWTKKKFQDVSEWILDNTEKWEHAKAVKSTKGYLVGGWAVA
jgi:hypothetical protein